MNQECPRSDPPGPASSDDELEETNKGTALDAASEGHANRTSALRNATGDVDSHDSFYLSPIHTCNHPKWKFGGHADLLVRSPNSYSAVSGERPAQRGSPVQVRVSVNHTVR
jgi:hypothetical protein